MQQTRQQIEARIAVLKRRLIWDAVWAVFWLAVAIYLMCRAASGVEYLSRGKASSGKGNREAIRKNVEAEGLQTLSGGDIHVDGTIICPERYQAGAIFAQKPTKLIQGKGAMFRLRGCGMQFTGQLQIEGNGVDPIFEIEGSSKINTGLHVFRDIVITNAPPAGVWVALATPDEAHADHCTIERCHVFGKEYTFFKSLNQQALNWTAIDCTLNIISDEDKGDIIGAHIIRGGNFKFIRPTFNCPRITIFKCDGVNPNTNRLICENFDRDVPTTTNEYLTVLDDSEVADWVDGWKASHWILKVSGVVPRHTKKYDPSRHFTKRALWDKERSVIQIDVVGEDAK